VVSAGPRVDALCRPAHLFIPLANETFALMDSPQKGLKRPQRWDVPFCDDMDDADVERVLATEPFSKLDGSKFRGKVTLEGILKNDARLMRCQPGQIIVRNGDWGNSAFFILSGAVRVELGTASDAGVSSEPIDVGRRDVQRKSLFQAVAQLWNRHPEPEYRGGGDAAAGVASVSQGSGEETRVYLADVNAVLDKHLTARMEAPHFFGEIAALGRTPRTATVFAEGEVELLEVRWQGLRDVMKRDEALKQQIDQAFRERALISFLRSNRLFEHLDDEQLGTICDTAIFETFGEYDSARPFKDMAQQGVDSGFEGEPLVAREGGYPDGLILIRSGLARLSHKHHHGHRTVGYLSPGHAYGFDEIRASAGQSSHAELKNSLRAIGFLSVVVIPTYLVEELLLTKPSTVPVPAAKPGRGSDRDADPHDPASHASHANDTFLEFLVDERFVQGTAAMVIDLDRCTRCDDCVRACAATHDNNPRFIRHGPVHDHFMIATACMHCSDPVCMIDCPTGAIHSDQLEGQVVINEATCIGCSSCANKCPYNAIRMVEVRDERGGFLREPSSKPLVQATKCDLCVDQLGGPSCQSACPHDALFRVDLNQFETIESLVS
jgi:Fe-S-cluster-containing dehydrogenase component/CRP-like cAMP-binding protein